MPVTTRSGLSTEEETPGPSSQTQEDHSQESHERPSKRRRRSSASDDQQPRRARARGPTTLRARAYDRPSPIRTHTGAVEPLTPPPTASLRRSPRRGRYLGQVLGTGSPILATPSPRSARDRPPTPYARRMSLPRSMRTRPPTPDARRMSLTRCESESEESEEEDWEPSLVIGRSLGENLSREETAYRTMKQWEAIYEHTLRETPAGAGPILERLEEARRDYNDMEMNEENCTPLNELASTRQAAISRRLRVLNYVLLTSECPPEAQNVRAAIQSYADGAIDLTRWTLFWNGRLVDTVESYSELCASRGERLDRYVRLHGEGWLWYEAPLVGEKSEESGGGEPRAMKSTCSDQNKSKWGLGSWNCTMGFRRVEAYVSRSGTPRAVPKKSILKLAQRQPRYSPAITAQHVEVKKFGEPVEQASARARKGTSLSNEMLVQKKSARMTNSEDYILKDDEAAATVHFDLLLDSGATFPLLYESDLRALGIDRMIYPAQSATRINAVNGGFTARLYEVRATITSEKGESLVNPEKPVHPREWPELGAVVPVAVLPPQGPEAMVPPSPVRLGEDGERKKERSRELPPGGRLSGMLPFMACYASIVPGSGQIWMGEDRNDVVGAWKFPGQRRLFLGESAEERELREMRVKKPKTRFEHRLAEGGRLVDLEKRAGRSELAAYNRRGRVTGNCLVDPQEKVVRFKK